MLELRLYLGTGAELGYSSTVERLHASFYCDGKQKDPASGMRHCQCADCCITTVTASAVVWDPPVSFFVSLVHNMCDSKRIRKFDVMADSSAC